MTDNVREWAIAKKKWTIYDIKHFIESGTEDNHFFDRDSMKFFGQTMKSFSVRHVNGHVFILADGKHGTITFREFVPGETKLKEFGVHVWDDAQKIIEAAKA